MTFRILAGLAIVASFFQGFLSMGFQLLASRVLAPFFGTTLIVWAFLISIFLTAFAFGSYLGGAVSQLGKRGQLIALAGVGSIGVAGFAFTAFFDRPLLRFLDQTYSDAFTGVAIGCATLFLVPVAMLSSILPVYAGLIGQNRGAGLSSGIVYGTSTVGNISGVLTTAFVLIPNFPTSVLLLAWILLSIGCFCAAAAVVSLQVSDGTKRLT